MLNSLATKFFPGPSPPIGEVQLLVAEHLFVSLPNSWLNSPLPYSAPGPVLSYKILPSPRRPSCWSFCSGLAGNDWESPFVYDLDMHNDSGPSVFARVPRFPTSEHFPSCVPRLQRLSVGEKAVGVL